MELPAEAYELLKRAPHSQDLDYQEALFECLKFATPESPKLSSLGDQVLNLKVRAAIERESLPKPGKRYPKPIVHGASRFNQ